MESVKGGLLSFCKGFAIWFVLMLLNTRSGEAGSNSIKIILDVIFAIILVGRYRNGKYIALLMAALTIMLTVLPLSEVLEVILLIGSCVLGGLLLKMIPEDDMDNQKPDPYENETVDPNYWSCKKWLDPFESYSYTPDGGVRICKGIIRRSDIPIPTTTTQIKIHQRAWQRPFGLCDVSFQNIYTGQQYGEDIMKNISLKSAIILMKII